ncbi:molybdopterin-guanine dinucleotide biosynthesis protein B [Salinicoccus hispanicus]|uniref:Molybdopterin-guanine dinucleotide biosynthesis protein B n=1 Tax=Salinicoccus hispanicus TaxID=157225 RepID=A0A6N8U515_9STAP|nr:molybdopterin-guanine dinucleotide biosynthesis protein B [Salinicoccus hispanicus]MXQ50689.1 molybdopterin-guanine dinucleotide biosynthesis protein B [Salinicoccus hispanicus]
MKILQVVGFKNTGKTTLVEKMIGLLRAKGMKAAVIKHHHLDHGIMTEGSDTSRFAGCGADVTILNTPGMSMRHENRAPDLKAQIRQLEGAVDVLLIEGYKHESHPKIVLTHSFTDGHTNVDEAEFVNVLIYADMRYDESKIIEWFDEWSSDDETV